jgi:hypothetical protein
MLNNNDFYVVIKLTSGEQVMAVLRQEDDAHVLIEHPMIMKTIVNFEAGKEHLTASPLCAFTDESEFVLPKVNILFIKKLHHVFIPHYQRIVKDHEESTLFVPAGQQETLSWDDEEMTPEKARKMISQLQGVLGEEREEIDWKEKLKYLVDGNDTLN